MAGYSGVPLPQKLGIKPQFKVAFQDLPSEVRVDLKKALALCQMVDAARQHPVADLDLAMIFVTTKTDLRKQFSRFAKQLAPAGMLWVCWPKKTSGMATGLTENEVRQVGLKAGLVDVKVCAVSEVWSGLKFVIRVRDRK